MPPVGSVGELLREVTLERAVGPPPTTRTQIPPGTGPVSEEDTVHFH